MTDDAESHERGDFREGDAEHDAQHIGVYRLRGRLGRGGMGEVFLAHDDRLDRPVAIKRIRPGREATEVERERFRREARAAAKLNHPAITQVYDVVQDDTGDSIVMEYVDGRTLAELLAAGGLDGVLASGVALQVAEGLAEAHAKGFVHRDLKAENVMVTPVGRAKILDFGLAKHLTGEDRETLTESGAVLGTFSTMSPEQAAGQEVDARSDLFSFGVLLYEVFTGRSPFRRRNRMLTIQSVLAERPPPPRALRPELPEALSALVEELLSKDPAGRPASAAEVAARLRESSGALAGLGPPKAAADTVLAAVESDAVTRSVAHAPRPGAADGVRPRWRRAAAVVLVAVALGAAAALLLRERTLHVVVVEPESRGGQIPGLVASGVADATLAFLYSLRGVVPIDRSGAAMTSDLPREQGTDEVLREEGADEVLRTTIDCPSATRCEISFRRYAARGRIRGVQTFEVIEPEEYLTLAVPVKSNLRNVYSERGLRAGVPELRVGREDYEVYLGLRRRVNAGEALDDGSFKALLDLAGRSPLFLEGLLLAAGVARDREEAGLALELARKASALAPSDPRPLTEELEAELKGGMIEEARSTLAKLEGLASGSERALRSRARLLAAQGKLDEAADAARRLVRARTSWLNLWHLADYEVRRGQPSAARRALERLLEISPRNPRGLGKLAEVELTYGDAARAEELYRRLIDAGPQRILYDNLGNALYRQGRYAEAEESYRQALAFDPGHVTTRFNLMLAEEALGRDEEARSLCRGLRDESDDELIRALCLVRLDAALEAVELATRALEKRPGSPFAAYLAAQVFALAGERNSALVRVGEALESGLAPGWFRVPPFRCLAGDAEFEEKLERFTATWAADR